MRIPAAVLVLVAAAAGAAVGFLAGRSTAGAPAPSGPPGTQAADDAAPPERRAERPPRHTRRVAAPAPSGAAADTVSVSVARPLHEDGLKTLLAKHVSGEIPAARVADVAARSRVMREQSLQAVQSSDASAAWEVAQEIAEERAFVADEVRGGTMQMLRRVGEKSVHMLDLTGDPAAFGALFSRRESGPAIDGPSWKHADGLAHGTTLRFPAGSHAWSVRGFRGRVEFPRDLLVQGAGMDATLVRLDELDTECDVTNLTFRDLTIDCGDDALTDLDGESSITLRLERCRVVGFDKGAGHSEMLTADTAAFYATDCRFEAGYGRTRPGSGNLFSVADGLLARLEGCVFRGPFSSVFEKDSAATYVFSNCRFERMREGFERVVASPPGGVRFEQCTVEEPAVESKAGYEKRPLSDFNAAWPSKTR